MRPRPLFYLVLVLGVLVALLGASFFFPRVQTISVTGNAQFTRAQILQIARLEPGQPWLWYGTLDRTPEAGNPWVKQLSIVKRFPSTVEVRVLERRPYARLLWQGRQVVVARDGTVLPGAAPIGPLIQGWGRNRRTEALEAVQMLREFGVRQVSYSPSGLRIVTDQGSLWSESLDSLSRYARVLAQTGGSGLGATMTYIYPWGVSVQR